jgi:membrane protease YdiL (CAAX protease family)
MSPRPTGSRRRATPAAAPNGSASAGTQPGNQPVANHAVVTKTESAQRNRRAGQYVLVGSGSVAWRHVICFVLLAYGAAWALWLPLIPAINDAMRNGRTPENFAATPAVVLGMYAPALAAVVMRVLISKEGLRKALGPLPSTGTAAAAVLLPVALVFIVVSIVTATHLGDATFGRPLPSLLATLTFVGVPIGTLLAFGEEFGWRGYLLPKLLPLGEVKAALIIGLIWGLWHLPVLIVGLNYPDQPILPMIAVFLVSTTLLSLLHTRFYVASGASLLAVALLHGSLNTFADRLTDHDHLSGNPLVVSAGGIIASGLLAVGLLVVYRVRARRTSS